MLGVTFVVSFGFGEICWGFFVVVVRCGFCIVCFCFFGFGWGHWFLGVGVGWWFCWFGFGFCFIVCNVIGFVFVVV